MGEVVQARTAAVEPQGQTAADDLGVGHGGADLGEGGGIEFGVGMDEPQHIARAVPGSGVHLPVTPLSRVLDETRRVLRPGGVLAALVPARSGLSPSGMLGWARVMGALRTVRQPWPNPRARDALAGVLRRSGFTIRTDERRVLSLTRESPDAVALLIDALYLPQTSATRTEQAKRSLAGWARPGRRLELPLRRVVAVSAAPSHRKRGTTDET